MTTVDDIRAHYQKLLATFGDTHEAAQYSSRSSQEARFQVLTEIGDLNGAKVLDFGCGTAHFATFLKARGIACDYIGVDIVAEFFDHARRKHPNARFGSWTEMKDEAFDYGFVSGVFNNRREDNESFYKDTLRELFARARKGLAFNMMSTYVDYFDDGLYYVKPEEVFAYVKGLTPFVTLRNDYLVKPGSVPFEFTVYAYRR